MTIDNVTEISLDEIDDTIPLYSVDINNMDLTELQKIMTNAYYTEKFRVKVLEKLSKSLDETEFSGIISNLTQIYSISGVKDLESLFYTICKKSDISTDMKLNLAQILYDYAYDDDESLTNEVENNFLRLEKAMDALDSVCYDLKNISSPRRVAVLYLLLESSNFRENAFFYFREFIRTHTISCEFRYKSILDIDKMENIKNSSEITCRLMKEFLIDKINAVYYRIMAGQYILTKDDKNLFRKLTEEKMLEISKDETTEYNRRADAADVLLMAGSDEYKKYAKEIIKELGRNSSNSLIRTIFDNAQNVHTESVEKSIEEAIKFLSNVKTLEVKPNTPIDLEFIQNEILDLLKEDKDAMFIETDNTSVNDKCGYCSTLLDKSCTEITMSNETEKYTVKVCSDECSSLLRRESDILLALNRISIDKALYSNCHSTLSHILIKTWSYIETHEFADEMKKRLMEELQEMAGTCSTGYATRIINSVTGFGEFGIKLSWQDQIISYFSNMLNKYASKLLDNDCIFRTNLDKQYEVIRLWLNSENRLEKIKLQYGPVMLDRYVNKLVDGTNLEEKDEVIRNWILSKNIDIRKYVEENNLEYEDLRKYADNNDLCRELIELYLSEDREEKLQTIYEEFSSNVINEMSLDTSDYSKRMNFYLFIGTYLSKIKEELYEEFKAYISSSDFDLYLRNAIFHYEIGG